MKGFLLLILSIIGYPLIVVYGQIPVGAWRDHLSWNTAEHVAVSGTKVYCSNGVGICVYDMSNRNMDKLTKVNGLGDVGVTALQYAASARSVMVGYANGNLDVIIDNQVYHIPDIKHNGIYTDKRINHIYVTDTYAYLSCSFGIVVVNIKARQIGDIYVIGDGGTVLEVFAMTEYDGYFYAATAQGIKKADSRSQVLIDFSSWQPVSNVPNATGSFKQIVSSERFLYACDANNRMVRYDGSTWTQMSLPSSLSDIYSLTISGNHLLISQSDAVLIYDAVTNTLISNIQSYNDLSVMARGATLDANGACWIADNRQGLVQWKSATSISFHLPNGPSSNNAAALRFKSDRLLVASGGRDAQGNALGLQGEIHTFYSNQWTSIRPAGAYDFTDVDISGNQPGVYYVSSWGGGLYVYENGLMTARYTQVNSTLMTDDCGGVLMDTDNKLWVSNDKNASILANGTWKGLQWQAGYSMGRFVEDNYQQIWTPLRNAGLWVFDKTSSERGQTGGTIRFMPYNYTRTSPIERNNAVVNTPDGIIWVGTAQGPVYYGNPSQILGGVGTQGVHPVRTGTDEPSHWYALLGSENILSVAIDGADRKWFGTETGGVFLISENNVGEVSHFTVDNSPLFSNKVHDIAINDKTGEVFFATEYGIVAYRGDAVSSGEDFGNVYVFPNPVRPEYQGEITITGLIKDANVKITDVAGNLVYQTRTLGGQAVWNGCNQKGRRVATGVYLVFCTNDDGSKTHVTKLLFIH